MTEGRVDLRQLGFVVNVFDVERPQVVCGKSGNTLLANRETDFPHCVHSARPGEDLFFLCVHRVEREFLGVEQAQNVIVEIQENLIHVLGGMDLVRDALGVLRVRDLILEMFEGFR